MVIISIGIVAAFLVILIVGFIPQLEKKIIFGLILAGLGFLYIGFTWSDLNLVIVSSLQAVIFLLFAYAGIRKTISLLTVGYFLHGAWDLLFHSMASSHLIPPNYHLFCVSFDWTVGLYLLVLKFRKSKTQYPKKIYSQYT
jgi:hypothetical protein